ncbi:hypothetical protein ACNKHK_11795 [Shigella flexneri]
MKNGYRYRHIYEAGVKCRFVGVSLHLVKSGMIGILDGNQHAGTQRVLSLGGLAISPDNTIMALAEDYLSRRQYGVRSQPAKRQLVSGSAGKRRSGFGIRRMILRLSISAQARKQALLPYQVWRHTVGSPSSLDGWCMKKPMTCFMSACIKPHHCIMWLSTCQCDHQ